MPDNDIQSLLTEVTKEVKAGNQRADEAIKKLEEQLGEIKGSDAKAQAEISALKGAMADLKSFGDRVDALEIAIKRTAKGDKKDETVVDEYAQKFAAFMRKEIGEKDVLAIEKKTLSTNSDPDGGVLVTPFIESEVSRIANNTVSMRPLCDVKTITRNRSYIRRVNRGGSSARWESEGEQNTANTNTPVFGKLEIVPGKMVAKPLVTEEMLTDSDQNVQQMLIDEVGIAFSDLEAAAFVNGNGVERPKGFLTYDTVANASWAWGKLGYVVTGVSGGFAAVDAAAETSPADNIVDLVHALPNKYRANAVFIANKLTIAKMRKFKDEDANFIWQDSLVAGMPDRLFGYPVIEVSDMPDIGAGSLSVAFGDFRAGYIIVDKPGMRVVRDEFTKKPDTEFCVTRRTGGGVHLFDAIKLLKFGTS